MTNRSDRDRQNEYTNYYTSGYGDMGTGGYSETPGFGAGTGGTLGYYGSYGNTNYGSNMGYLRYRRPAYVGGYEMGYGGSSGYGAADVGGMENQGYGGGTATGYGVYGGYGPGYWGQMGGGYGGEQNQGPYTGRGPRNYRRSDERICADINERLTQHGYLDATDIDVSVQNGIVTLGGEVDNRREKRLAEDIADSVPGVLDVANRLQIRQGQQQSGNNQGS